MNLYDKYAEQFSNTRQNPWLGWQEVLFQIKEMIHHGKLSNPIRILDLGCGNGRFAKFLLENQIECEYIGVDKSAALLGIAKQQIIKFKNLAVTVLKENAQEVRNEIILTNGSNFKFIKADLENENWGAELPEGNFDLIVSFGLMHHIAPFETRKQLLSKALNLLNSPGLLAVTFWQFGALERYKSKMTKSIENKGIKYSENDYTLTFGKDAKRFCHFVTEKELTELEEALSFSTSKTFINDGRENNENIYRLYFK